MARSGMKDIHFEVPLGIFEAFQKAFPGRGERKVILTAFVEEAINLQRHKNYFTKLVANNVGQKYIKNEIEGL